MFEIDVEEIVLPSVINGIVKSTAVRLSYVMVRSQIAISAFYIVIANLVKKNKLRE